MFSFQKGNQEERSLEEEENLEKKENLEGKKINYDNKQTNTPR